MATLYIRDVPADLHRQIQELAESERRSLGAQAMVLIERALQGRVTERTPLQVLAEIRARREKFPLPPGAPDSVELLREDRER